MQNNIIVEIGTEDQKALINSELKFFLNSFGEKINAEINCSYVYVPSDFDKKVNELKGTTTYQSSRGGHRAMAKILSDGEKNRCIVLSPYLYTDAFNMYIRLHIFSHEMFHLLNKNLFKIPEFDGTARIRYISHLMTLYDEYSANRFSHMLVNGVLRLIEDLNAKDFMSKYFYEMYRGHLEPLQDSSRYYDVFFREINKFRIHGNIARFLIAISDLFDQANKDVIYLFAYVDEFDSIREEVKNIKSLHFVNEDTHELIQTFQKWYLKEEPFNFESEASLDKIKAFISNFGMFFEDTENGEYCHVLDICKR